jgi:hypothetical protein
VRRVRQDASLAYSQSAKEERGLVMSFAIRYSLFATREARF